MHTREVCTGVLDQLGFKRSFRKYSLSTYFVPGKRLFRHCIFSREQDRPDSRPVSLRFSGMSRLKKECRGSKRWSMF